MDYNPAPGNDEQIHQKHDIEDRSYEILEQIYEIFGDCLDHLRANEFGGTIKHIDTDGKITYLRERSQDQLLDDLQLQDMRSDDLSTFIELYDDHKAVSNSGQLITEALNHMEDSLMVYTAEPSAPIKDLGTDLSADKMIVNESEIQLRDTEFEGVMLNNGVLDVSAKAVSGNIINWGKIKNRHLDVTGVLVDYSKTTAEPQKKGVVVLNIAEPAIQFSDDDGRDQKISLETFAQKTDISNSLNDVEIRFAPGTPYKQIFRERETLKQLKDYILKYQERDTSEL